MSLHQSPTIVTDGLVFYMDMNNVQKSWIGPPVTNQFPLPTPSLADGSTTFPVQGTGTFKRIYTGTYGGYTIDRDKDVVYRYDLGINGCHYHGNTITVAAGQTITFSFDYYVDPSSANYPTVNYIANIEGTNGGALTDPTPSEIGVWKRGVIKSGATVAGNYNVLFYPGACSSSYLASSGFILYKNPQVEISSPGGNPTAYTPTSRSNTNAIKDLTGKNTITANSLTYASDGTFSFNGSDNYISTTNVGITHGNEDWTYTAWLNWSGLPSLGTVFENGAWASSLLLRFETSGFSVFSMGTSWGFMSFTPVLNRWYHVSFVRRGNSVFLYVDGVEISSLAFTANIVPNTNLIYIGMSQHAAGQCFNGKISASSIYTRGLTSSEIQQNFNALRGRYGI